jgi:uncharacterized membrane protein
METTTPTRAAERRSSAPLTIGLGLVVLVAGAIFALESSWYPNWYSIFRVVHVVLAVFWVGGGLTLTVLGLRAQSLDDPGEMATLARQAAFVGERLFAPSGLVVLLMGIALVINGHLGWGHFWVIAGLVGYAATFVTGIAVLSPLAKKVDELIRTKGAADAETIATINRILLVARVDVTVLLLVIVDMTVKPFS